MVRLRMQRFGRRHRPFFRINAIDQRTRRNGRVIESLGHYDPLHPDQTKQVVLKSEQIRAWLDKGAQPSDTVRDLLATHEILNATEMKAWEADRQTERNLTICRKSVKACEEAVKSIEGLSGDGDTTAQLNGAKKALTAAKATMAGAKHEDAAKAAADAQAQLDAAKNAAAATKPEPAPAPAPEEAPAEATEGESTDA